MSSIGATKPAYTAASWSAIGQARTRAYMDKDVASLLDDGAYNFASKTKTGVGAVMLFSDSWQSPTGNTGSMLDYFV